MFRVSVIVCALLAAIGARAQVANPGAELQKNLQMEATARTRMSASRQFVIRDVPETTLRPLTLNSTNASNYVHVDAAVMAVTCERIRDAFLSVFDAQNDQWRGRVSIYLHRARSFDEPVTIAATVSGQDWSYYLDVPDTVDHTRLVSGIVSALLLENANRGSVRGAELPAWLIQGMARELTFISPAPLVVNEPQRRTEAINGSSIYMQGSPRDPLSRAREDLRVNAPLSLEELSWPKDRQDETVAFRASSQLLVHELLALKDGPRRMADFIASLSRNLNWQVGFYGAFQNNFEGPRDLEKWWALKIVAFTGRDLTRTLSSAESWRKLDDALRTTVLVRSSANELPATGAVTLQSVITEWNTVMQADLIREKLKLLESLRASTAAKIGPAYEDYQLRNNARPLQVSQDLINLVDDYRRTLEAYYKKRDDAGLLAKSKLEIKPGLDKDARETIRRLDMLDAMRMELKPAEVSKVTVSNPNL